MGRNKQIVFFFYFTIISCFAIQHLFWNEVYLIQMKEDQPNISHCTYNLVLCH